MIFRDHLQAKEWFIPVSRRSSIVIRRPSWMKKELLDSKTKLVHKKEVYKRQKWGQVTQGKYGDNV